MNIVTESRKNETPTSIKDKNGRNYKEFMDLGRAIGKARKNIVLDNYYFGYYNCIRHINRDR